MANVTRYFFSWIGNFPPGASHSWAATGFNYGDVLSATAHPVTGNPTAAHRVLRIDDMRIDGTPTGRSLLFTVRNVGTDSIPGYGLGISLTV